MYQASTAESRKEHSIENSIFLYGALAIVTVFGLSGYSAFALSLAIRLP